MELKTNEAFRACDTEIAGLEGVIKELEEKELVLMENVEDGRRALAEAKEELENQKAAAKAYEDAAKAAEEAEAQRKADVKEAVQRSADAA